MPAAAGAAVFFTLIGGCVSVDRGVSQSAGVPWIPPEREAAAQRKQLESSVAFDAALIDATKELDLPMLLDIAFENSPVTKKSWHAARIAAAQSGKASSIFFPKITISGVAEKTESNLPATSSRATDFYPAVELQYSIFQFGGRLKSADAAKQLLYAANYQHNWALQTLANGVHRCYFALDSAECAVEASQRNLEDALVAYDAAFLRNQAGLSNVQDFLQAKANKARAESELEDAKSHVEIARADLANAIGVRVSSSLRIARSGNDESIKDLSVNIHDLVEETILTRPDVSAAHAAVRAAKNSIWTSYSKLAPELVLGVSGSKKYYDGIRGSFNNFNIYAALRWTVFDGFNNVYDIVESKEKLKQAEQDLRKLELAVASDVWSKYHAFESALRQLHASKNYEQVSQESFDSIVIAYDNGLSPFVDLMAAQTQLASARLKTIQSKNNLSMTVVDLAYAVGIMSFDYKK
ncbi:MAG: TolC family protein [Puniceicoccales bacterium]|nr:TolC family protein [Puniceicoccales bacterium]